jgi:2-keto-4-pentenoate hydratase/2-oxohepta-3-ene-1,7-dioic acid hydratase in catechol pathway
MRFATVLDDDQWHDAVVRDDHYLPLDLGDARLTAVRRIASSGADGLHSVEVWADAQPRDAWRSLDVAEEIGPPLEPGAIYTIGQNYRSHQQREDPRSARPLVYGKAPASVAGHGGVLWWDRTLTANVDAEVELGIVIGTTGWRIAEGDAIRHVFGYTVVNDVSSRDPWLDGDQWLLGKSMNGFCPMGPWIVTADELALGDLRLGCTINGAAIQDGTTADMRFSVAEIVTFISRHVTLLPGDLIASGTPERLGSPPGPGRHLERGDVVTAWIEGIGELTSTVTG